MRHPLTGTLPSGKSFSVDLRLNHPSLLPGVQILTEDSLLERGKKLRPKLCFLFAEALEIPLEQVAPYARVAELVHAATLAHDDVIDEATERRGKPTLNGNLTQARAILSGDLLLARALSELCELKRPEILSRVSEVLEDLATGEWLQLEYRNSFDVNQRMLETVAKLKTASLLEWCAQVPFYLSDSDSESLMRAREFGRHLGIAFQCIDDCLDFSALSQKDFNKDLKEGLLNQVTLEVLSLLPDIERNFQRFENHFIDWVDSETLHQALFTVKARASQHGDLALHALRALQENSKRPDAFKDLGNLVEKLLDREA